MSRNLSASQNHNSPDCRIGVNLFTYGSLIFPEVWKAVTGRTHRSTPANIEGFIRRTLRGATYPGILATGEKNASVSGVVYHDIEPQSLAALDEFESDFYLRKPVGARSDDGTIFQCEAYVITEEFAHLLSDAEWDIETFATHHLEAFLGRNFFA